MNLEKIYKICSQKETLLECLQLWTLIPPITEYKCDKCGGKLKFRNSSCRLDGWEYMCFNKVRKHKEKRKICKTYKSFRRGTFFSRSSLSIQKILCFANLWVSNFTLDDISNQLDLSKTSVISWASYCRDVIYKAYSNNPEKIGGPGVEVEVNESKFRKRTHEGLSVEGAWVFGGYERDTGRIFMVKVEQNDWNSILPLILQWINKGTTIISDCWKTYHNDLSDYGYTHITLDQSPPRILPKSIESLWHNAKTVSTPKGRNMTLVPGNLARYMFYKRCEDLGTDRTMDFFRLIGKVYDPRKEINSDDEVIETSGDEKLEFR